jgi:hypothetical protein
MVGTPCGEDRSAVVPGVSAVLANLLPLVGAARFGWDPETLAVVYTLELLVSLPVVGVKALFADQPPVSTREGGAIDVSESGLVEKRGYVRLRPWLPPVYPRNIAFAAAVFLLGHKSRSLYCSSS